MLRDASGRVVCVIVLCNTPLPAQIKTLQFPHITPTPTQNSNTTHHVLVQCAPEGLTKAAGQRPVVGCVGCVGWRLGWLFGGWLGVVGCEVGRVGGTKGKAHRDAECQCASVSECQGVIGKWHTR